MGAKIFLRGGVIHHGERERGLITPGRGGNRLGAQEACLKRCSVKERGFWLSSPLPTPVFSVVCFLLLLFLSDDGEENRGGQDKKIQDLQWWPVGIFLAKPR